MDGFFQNLGKEGWRTFMHTTVPKTNKIFVLISVLSSKKRSNKKNKGSLLCKIAPNLYNTSNPLNIRKTKLLKTKTTELVSYQQQTVFTKLFQKKAKLTISFLLKNP